MGPNDVVKFVFNVLDMDRNGSVAPTEFIIFMANSNLQQYHKPGSGDAHLLRVFQEADEEDGKLDGELNLEEVTALFFAKADTNLDGELTLEELRAFLE